MRHETITPMPRAVVGSVHAENDPKAVIGKIPSEVEGFKDRYDGRIANFQNAVDDLNTKIAALGLGENLPMSDTRRPVDPEYTSLFASYARSGKGAVDLHEANTSGERREINAAMTAGAGEGGGYLAPTEWNRQILKAQRSISPIRQIATVIETTVRAYSTLWNAGGWGTGWVGETATRPETATATLKPVIFTHGEIYANPLVTQTLLDDADFPLETWLASELGEEFTRQEGVAFLSGDGANKPTGFLTHATGATNATAHPGGAIPTVPSGSASAISTDSLITLVFALPAPNRQNARFLMNSLTLSVVSKFKDAGGNYIWQPSYADGVPQTLLGYPITIDEGMPDVAAGALPIAFADFRRLYVINDRTGVRVLRDPFTNKPYVSFYTTKRVGGGVNDPTVGRLLKIAAS